MNKNQRARILKAIADKQMGDKMGTSRFYHHGTSSVTIKIGGTTKSGQVEHDVIYILESNQSIIELVKDFVDTEDNMHMSMSKQGLRIS